MAPSPCALRVVSSRVSLLEVASRRKDHNIPLMIEALESDLSGKTQSPLEARTRRPFSQENVSDDRLLSMLR